MNKKERLFNAIDGKPIDRHPYVFWKHLPPDRIYGDGFVEEHLRFCRETGVDMIKIMIDGFRNLDGHLKVERPSDWRHIKLPQKNSSFVQTQLELLKRIEEAADEIPIYYHTFNPLGFLRWNWGNELVTSHLENHEARADILYALAEMTKFLEEYLALFLTRSPACAVSITVVGAEQDSISDEMHRNVIAPSDLRVIEAANGYSDYNMLHPCCLGKHPNRIMLWRDYPAAVMTVNCFEDAITIPKAQDCFPKVRAFLGGFDVRPSSLLASGTREAIAGRVAEICRESENSRWILGAANTVLEEVPNEHIRWVGEALGRLE